MALLFSMTGTGVESAKGGSNELDKLSGASMGLRMALQAWQERRAAILADTRLSVEGQKERLQVLDATEPARLRALSAEVLDAMVEEQTARRAVLAAWQAAEAGRWDYNRLQLTRDVLSAKLAAAPDGPAILRLHQKDEATGDPYATRAWALRAPELMGHDDREVRILANGLSLQLARETDPELANFDLVARGDALQVRAHDLLHTVHGELGGQEGTFLGRPRPDAGIVDVVGRLRKRVRVGPAMDGPGMGQATWVDILPEAAAGLPMAEAAVDDRGVGIFG